MAKFLVTADHVSPNFRLVSHPVEVREYTMPAGQASLYYAVSKGLGCGKNASTPERAIRSLVGDQACTNIRIAAAN